MNHTEKSKVHTLGFKKSRRRKLIVPLLLFPCPLVPLISHPSWVYVYNTVRARLYTYKSFITILLFLSLLLPLLPDVWGPGAPNRWARYWLQNVELFGSFPGLNSIAQTNIINHTDNSIFWDSLGKIRVVAVVRASSCGVDGARFVGGFQLIVEMRMCAMKCRFINLERQDFRIKKNSELGDVLQGKRIQSLIKRREVLVWKGGAIGGMVIIWNDIDVQSERISE